MSKVVGKNQHWTEKITNWVGSSQSVFIHSCVFLVFLFSPIFGFSLDRALLVLTTLVSLEAIYLALFIQMSLNRTNIALEHVEEVQEEISEDIENIEKDIDEIQEDVEEISEDVEEISEDVEDIQNNKN